MSVELVLWLLAGLVVGVIAGAAAGYMFGTGAAKKSSEAEVAKAKEMVAQGMLGDLTLVAG